MQLLLITQAKYSWVLYILKLKQEKDASLEKCSYATDCSRSNFDILLIVHLSIILAIDQLKAQFLVFNKFIIFLYRFRALLCSSSGG
jgi:hypothetical protein